MSTSILRPAAGQYTALTSGENSQITLGFPADQATLERAGDALTFRFDDGASVSITDFYTAYSSENAPEFEVDGQLISSAEFFKAFGPDLAPAAGPSAAERSSHYSEHGTAELSAGIDHLDGLDMSLQGTAAQVSDLAFDSALAAAGDSSSGGIIPPGPAPVPPAPVPPAPGPDPLPRPDGPFVRAVLYNSGNTNDPVTTSVFFAEDGQPPMAIPAGSLDFTGAAPWVQYEIAVSLPDGWQNSWVDVAFDYSTGRLEFRLTADGIAEMQRMGADGKPLIDFIQVTVTDRYTGNEFEYNVELVATDNQNFNSSAHDSLYGDHANLEGIGEFHQGKGETGAYSIVSSDRNDEIILNDTVIGGSSIHASGSANPQQMADDYNTINLNQGILASQPGQTTHITSSDGKLTIAQGVAATAQGGGNIIDMGKGAVSITNAGNATAVMADKGQNSISGHDISISGAKNLVTASNGGSNTIHGKGGNVNLTTTQGGGYALLAESGGRNHIIAEDGSLKAETYGLAGVKATGGGQNTLEGRGNATVTVNSYNGEGMLADGGSNTVSAEDGKITVLGRSGAGIRAADDGLNSISGKQIDITGNGGAGAIATGSGENIVTGNNGTVNIRGTSGLLAESGENTVSVNNGSISVYGSSSGTNAGASAVYGGSNTINATGSTTVSATGYQYGLYAANGSNTVTAEDGKVTISGNYGAGMAAGADGVNRVDGSDITVTSYKNAVDSLAGGKNYINAGEDGKVTIQGGSYYGVNADGENSLVEVKGGEVSVKGSSGAVHVTGKGTVDIDGNTVDLTAVNGRTVDNWSGGTINVTAEDELNVRLTNASQSSAAVMTLGGVTTLKSGGDVNLIVDKGTYQTAGINTWSFGTTNVEAENDINIKVHAEKGSGVSYGASGIQIGSTHGGANNIVAKHGDITLDVDSSTSGAYGITTSGSSSGKGVGNITAKEGTLTVNVTGTGDAYNAGGISSSGYGTNNIDVGNLDVNVNLAGGSNYQGGHGASAISASYNGQYYGVNNIDVSGDMNVSISSGGNTSGILAQGSQSNISAANNIHAKNFTLDVTSTGILADSRATGIESNRLPSGGSYAGGDNIINVDNDASINVTAKDLAAGFYSTYSGKQILTAGGDVDMNVTSTAGKAYGVFGGASITGDSVTMTIKGDLSAIVLDGKATVTGSTINLNAESANGTAYGMYNTGGGTNTVQSGSGQGLNLEINADYAMYATAGKNVILGHSVSGGEGDVIRLNGDIYRSGSGSNQIVTGAGNDTIIIDGVISGAGALNIDGGAGADTLILQAADLGEFIARYGSWLNGLNSSILKGVEKIEFAGIDDLNDLRPGLDSFFAYVDGVQPPIEVAIHEPDVDPSAFSAFGLDDDGILFDTTHDHQDQEHGTSHAESDQGYPAHDGLGGSLVADLGAQGHVAASTTDLPSLSDGGVQVGSPAAESNLASDPYAHVGLSSGGESLDNLLPDKASPTPTGNGAENASIEAVPISTVADTAHEMIEAAARQVESL
ncbi:MAG: hypothetical protein QM579_05210 [Desulfovibrio sp.]|uniref:beta strand repeat-containing protein n=1 Tax=Desulfovibrio sp. TaxID=885 RepID=UPI0039E394E6